MQWGTAVELEIMLQTENRQKIDRDRWRKDNPRTEAPLISVLIEPWVEWTNRYISGK